jgi:hypothetical protein
MKIMLLEINSQFFFNEMNNAQNIVRRELIFSFCSL